MEISKQSCERSCEQLISKEITCQRNCTADFPLVLLAVLRCSNEDALFMADGCGLVCTGPASSLGRRGCLLDCLGVEESAGLR